MRYSTYGSVFKCVTIFSNLFLKTPTLPRAAGWATMPCMLIIENSFKHVHEKGGIMSYTLDPHYIFLYIIIVYIYSSLYKTYIYLEGF